MASINRWRLRVEALEGRITPVNVGYFDLQNDEGRQSQVLPIEIAEFDEVLIKAISSQQLGSGNEAKIDILFAQNSTNQDYSGSWVSTGGQKALDEFVDQGGVIILHDRLINNNGDIINDILPGAEDFVSVRDPSSPGGEEIEVVDETSLFANGIGGELRDDTLDGGAFSSNGYVAAKSLPAGTDILLTRNDPEQAVTFSYPVGEGYVIYSTVPLDRYLNDMDKSGSPSKEFREVYAPNLLRYARSLTEPDPMPQDDVFSVIEDNVLSVGAPGILGNDDLPDGTTLNTDPIVDVQNGELTLNADGSFTYTPNEDFFGVDSFTYRVATEFDKFAEAVVTINVEPVADAPTTDSFTVTTDEDVAFEFSVSDFPFADGDGDDFTAIRIEALPALGTLEFAGTAVQENEELSVPFADGELRYVPPAGEFGSPFTTFDFVVGDETGLFSSTETVIVNVLQDNDPPAAGDNTVTTDEDVRFDFAVGDFPFTDADGDPLAELRVETLPTEGLLLLDGTPLAGPVTVAVADVAGLSYQPAADESGDAYDSFTFSVGDGELFSDPATLTIDVEPVNDAPVANPEKAETPEDTTVTIDVLANDTDVDQDELSVISAEAMLGSVEIVDNQLAYTPPTDFVGTDVLEYEISDGNGGTDMTMIMVDVTPVNDAPVASVPGPQEVEEDGLLFFSEFDANAITFSDVDAEGADVRVTLVVNEGTLTLGDVSGVTLVDGTNDGESRLAIEGPIDAINAAIDGLFYEPNADFFGADELAITVDDLGNTGNGGPLTDEASVAITVLPINDGPVVTAPEAVSTPEDTPEVIDGISVEDIDVGDGDLQVFLSVFNGTLTLGSTDGIGFTGGTGDGEAVLAFTGTLEAVNAALAGLNYSPAENFNGDDTLSIIVDDLGNTGGDSFPGSAEVAIEVTPVNDAPVAEDDGAATDEDVPVEIDVLANDFDVDEDALAVAELGEPANGSVTLNADGSVTYTPAPNFFGVDAFTYTVTDGALTDTAMVIILISAVNDAPVAEDDEVTTGEDTPATFPALVSDVDEDDLTITVDEEPADGTVTVNDDGTFTYTPDENFFGDDSFAYTVSDGELTDSATVLVTVTPVNDAPVAEDDGAATDEDVPVEIDVLANDFDVDEDALAVAELGEPANGSVTLNADGSVTYTPAPNFFGQDNFTYTVSDGDLTDTATVFVTVAPVNDAPVANDDEAMTDQDVPVEIDVLANDFDIEEDALTVTIETPSADGDAAVNADGTVTFTPNAGFFGTTTFTYTLSDGDLTDTATVTVEVIQAPTGDLDAVDDDLHTLDCVPVTGNVLDNDVFTGEVTVTLLEGPEAGELFLNEDGTFRYIPEPGFVGIDEFTYLLSDAVGNSDSAAVRIEVKPIDKDTKGVEKVDDVLVIVGTDRNDTVKVYPTNGDGTGQSGVVVYSDINRWRPRFFEGVRAIKVIAKGGSDFVYIKSTITIPTVVAAGEGNNTVRTGRGDDIVYAGRGYDSIKTYGGDDIIEAGDGTSYIRAGDGDNRITAGQGYDNVGAGDGDDTIDVGDGGSYVHAGDGDNRITAGDGYDNVRAGGGDDLIDVGDGGSYVFAGAGDDFVIGGHGNDCIHGGGGNDILLGGSGRDQIEGGDGSDLVVGGSGNDQLKGGDGDDMLADGAVAPVAPDELRGILDDWIADPDDPSISPRLGATPDGDFDELIGGYGTDEFWAESRDRVFRRPDERVN